MKFKNKILASMLALVMIFAGGLPILINAKANATSAVITSSVLQVKKNTKTYDVTTDYTLNFVDYCPDYTDGGDIQAIISGPRAEDTSCYKQISGGVEFKDPGLYMLRFKKLDTTSGIYIYSDPIYIPVSNNNTGKINLDGSLNNSVKPGTTVIVPMPIDNDWNEDTDVHIKVYTPYGEEVEANKSSVDNKWRFTNKPNVLGTYYVEYTKTVSAGGFPITIYKYETIEFTIETSNTNSTKTETKPTEDPDKTTENAGLIVDTTDIYGEADYIYLYKYYNVNNAYVRKEDGSTDTSAVIYLAVYDATVEKYYNFATGKFELGTSNEAKVDISTITERFILRTIDNLSTMSADGHRIKFVYSTTINGEEATKEIERTERFSFEWITVGLKDLLPSELTNCVITEETTPADIASIVLSAISVGSTQPNMDLDGLRKLVSNVILYITPAGSDQISSENGLVDGIGIEKIDVSPADPMQRTFKYNYNKKIQKEMTLSIQYLVQFEHVNEDEGRSFSGSKTVDGKIYARTETKDNTSPSGIIIDNPQSVSYDGKYTIPNASAVDKDDQGNTTSGAKITVEILGGAYTTKTAVSMGEQLTGLKDGAYILIYTAVDYNGNTRVKKIGFIVANNTETDFVAISASGADVVRDGNKITATVDSDADYVMIYEDGKAPYMPGSVKYNNGVCGFSFELEEGVACVAVLAKGNSCGTTYVAFKIADGVIIEKNSHFLRVDNTNYSELKPNTSVEVKVGEKLIWTGSDNFEIETDGVRYTIEDGRILNFLDNGVLTIKSVEEITIDGVTSRVNATTTITVKTDNYGISISSPFGNKRVAKKGEQFKINYPVVTNYFGYTLKVVVKDSDGNILENPFTTDGNYTYFTAPKNDEFSFEYIYSGEGVSNQTTSYKMSSGNISAPKISISENNENKIWKGEKISYIIKKASAVDKNGLALDVTITCFDQYGKQLNVSVVDGNYVVELSGAGFYTVYYTAIDSEGKKSIVTDTFAVEFEETEEKTGLSVGAIIAIIVCSLAGACAVAFVVYIVIKNNKKKHRFINKNRQAKKEDKKKEQEVVTTYTIAESKDSKHWLVKNGNRTIAKASTKDEAIQKAKEFHKKGEMTIKVYNKLGRLIDSL